MQKYTLALLVVVLCAPMLLANRENRGNRQSQKQVARACNYQWGECKLREGATCGNGKKTGTSDSAECPSKQIEKKCKVKCQTAETGAAKTSKTKGGASCKYKNPRGDSAAPCDPQTNTQTVVQTLASGSPASCQPTNTVQKPCRRSQSKQRVPRAVDDAEEEVGGDARCKYRRGQKGECNAVTKKRTITMTLKRKSPPSCAPTKTIEKPCKVKPAKQDKAERRQQKQAGRPNRRRQGQDQ